MKEVRFLKMRKHRLNKYVKQIVAFMAATVMLLTSMPLGELSPALSKLSVIIAHAVNPPRRASVTYNDLADFAAYSIEYSASPDAYCEDTIILTLNTGYLNSLPSNYIPLGTEDAPFNGKILITQNYGYPWWFETDKPLFDYITDSATINYADENHNTEPIQIEIRRMENSTLAPLFANHVKPGGASKATWKIKSAVQNQETGDGVNILVCNTSGLIGDIKEDANVTIDFVNNAYDPGTEKRSNVEASGDIGLICQTMYENSRIDLTLSGTNNGCLISSTSNGNAGGLVGRMKSGSVLKLNSTYTPAANRSITAVSGYAGGLVGYNEGGKIIFPENAETEIRGSIIGTSGAGGLYGYYSNYVDNNATQSVTVDMKNYDIDCTVKATYAGGLVGELNGTADFIVDGSASGSNEITVSGDTVTNFGGIAGTYQTNALTNKFEVNTVTANTEASFTTGDNVRSYYGGVCGQITGDQSGYVKVSSFTHKSSAGFADATAFGGVVGDAGTAGSMLDVGSVTIETGVASGAANGSAYNGGGIVGKLTDGVLRLSGTTNMQKAPSASGSSNGQLVGARKDSLVYAVGSGNSGDSNWEFNRSATQVEADDIGTWGSVLRISGIETDVLTFDPSAHTVTVKAPVTAITSAVDFTKTALNMQLNSGNKGALRFADSTNTKSALMGTNLSFSGTVDLTGTGNIGLMRDDYKDNVSEIGAYTNTISSGTVKLAIGERYGSPSTGIGRGDIIAHRYNGLIARTGEITSTSGQGESAVTIHTPASISGLTIDGTINVNATIGNTYVGGAVAVANKGINLINVTAQEKIDFNVVRGTDHAVGGITANVSGGNTAITGGTAKTEIVLTGTVSSIPVGGAIGKINNANKAITASSITIAANIDASGATATDMAGAGFIADISGGTMTLTGVTVNGTKLKNAASSHSGGFLGMKWLGTDVSFTANNGVIVSGTANELDTSASYAAGLVQYATGHWTVPEKGIQILGMTIKTATNSLGLLVHDGYSGDNGLYLELTNKDSYDLATTGITIPDTTNYDELVRSTGSDILSNGSNGIISITTDGNLIMDGTSCNTYQNKYNKSNVSNSKSRYYYNLTSICKKAVNARTDGEKLLLWSLNKYAATNINSNFKNSLGTTLAGNFDLGHISYYPIDCPDNLTIGDATFTFYNDEIEASEQVVVASGNSDSSNRTTRGDSQHFLMHSGVFRNVSKTITTNGNIHFKGCIGVGSHTEKVNDVDVTVVYSGALINGTLNGSLTTATNKEIVFEGLTISDTSKYLFINKMTTNSKLTLSGVRTGGGKDFSNTDKSSTETKYSAGATVASSLIGDVSGNGIQISFDRMKLDSRITPNSPADWLAQYGTTKSIFSGATFLNKFNVDSNSTGKYDFDEALDWDGSTHNANVTYGQEIKTSVESVNKQQKYLDQANFVDPVAVPSSVRTVVYDFDSGFLPYVKYSTATYPTGDNATRELKVNIYIAGLSEGCGTYNHPYKITTGSQLYIVATSINKVGYFSSLRLPKIDCDNDSNLDNLNSEIGTHWCDEDCAVFEHGSGVYTFTENGTTYTWTEEQVSLYLASAYYIIMNNIDIVDNSGSDQFKGLGASPTGDTTGKYAFRGVIVGASSDGSITITNKTGEGKTNNNSDFHNTMGLITMSNGCVVKDLTIKVDFPDTDKYQYRSNGNKAYGYDENFTNYGAVINKIMGGDNIIDNVTVQFEDTLKVYSESNDYKATIGGYVGCVVNGGLIFRNVDDSKLKRTIVNGETTTTVQGFKVIRANSSGVQQEVKIGDTVISSSTVEGSMTDADDLIHIHVNPFVGRVINGYAIRESDHYAFSEDGETYGDGETRANAVEVTMHNTRKNYSIPDIDATKNFEDASASVLTFSKPEGETSYNTITVPNSQALYIMSIIAQSGAGCAGASSDNEDYAYNISYCGTGTRSYSGNTAQNNKATHWASYNHVGTATSSSDEDYDLSTKDTVNSKKAIPYIIYKYTSSYTSGTDTLYPARTLTKRTFYVNLAEGETYYLPDCFRGIGFLGSNTLDDNMKIYGFNGNGTSANPTVIDVNTEYFLNQRADDPYFGSNINAEYKVGIGLFNNLRQSSSTGFDRKYESDSKYQITNFTLHGYLSAHHVSSSGADQNANPTDNRDQKSMNTAGLVPTLMINEITHYNFSNILFNKLHINSYAYAGGFVAFTESCGVMIYINNCNADGFKVEGSGRIAGFVGSYDTNLNNNSGIHINTGLDSSGKDNFASVMRNTMIRNKLSTDVKQNYTAGILGCIYSSNTDNNFPIDNGDNAKGHLILRNVTIEGGNAETNYIGNKDNPNGSSGGIMGGGSGRVRGCLIQNCTVKNIDIYGKFAGGIFGENANRMSSMGCSTSARISGCSVTGDLNDNGQPQYSIMARYYAGGVYGEIRDNGTYNAKYKNISANNTDYVEYKTDIDGLYVYGYNIISINQSNENTAEECTANSSKKAPTSYAAGGITGNNDNNRTIQNCKVEKCVIDVGTNADSATNTPCGGLIGRMNSGTLNGYNIEVKDCDFYTHQWSNGEAVNVQKAYSTDNNTPVSGMMCGNVIGNGNSKTANITAIHVSCPAPNDFNSINSSSFIVYADYNDVAASSDKGTEMSTLSVLPTISGTTYANAGEGGMKDYFPNVNVSPVIQMGDNTILTGDGAALYYNKPVVDAIVNDEDSNYLTVPSDAKTYIQHALQSTSYTNEPNKISTYKTEMGTLPDGVDDFTVLVINSENRAYSTAFINNYIEMVSNTDHNYMDSTNRSGKYQVDVYPCTFDGTKYVKKASGKSAGLEVQKTGNNYEYFMRNTHADSNQGDYQFSLMDIQFFNPNTSIKEVVYHLYIPVLTKKMLMFNFYSGSQSGTDNKAANFDSDNFGNTLAESLNSWYTAYMQFTYSQTELQSILESGAGFNWNGAKTVLLKYQTNTVEAKLSADTQLVLCDPNNSDKYYYATLGSIRSTPDRDGEYDTIRFADFYSELNSSGNRFSAATLNDMLLAQGFKITAQTASAGTPDYVYSPTSVRSEADVIVSDNEMYKKAESSSSGTVKLTISYPKEDNPNENDDTKVLVENYYLAVRADGNSVYNYSIRTTATTSGGTDKPTLRRANVEEGNVTNIIMGNLYKQTVRIDVLNNNSSQKEINATNHRLDVTLSSTIQLTGSDSDKDYMLNHLSNPNIHLYHSFIIYLTAKDETGNRSEILGTPDVTTDFRITGNGRSHTEDEVAGEVTGSFIQLKHFDIKGYLSKTGAAMITAGTKINFAEAWQYNAEFPVQDGLQDDIGVNVSARSNLSYTEDKLRFTNMTDNPDPLSTKHFYIKESDKASLIYNMKSEILDEYDKVGEPSFNYSQQGINPRNFSDDQQDRLPVKTTATYSATNIRRSDFMNAKQIQYTLKLYKKTDTLDGVEYHEVTDIADYIDLSASDSVFIKIDSGVTSAPANGEKMTKAENNLLTYTANINQQAFTVKDNQRFSADIDFTVITGAGFKDYANYRFVLDVDLLDEDGDPLTTNSNARDWVVYTNAKINPDMLTLSEYNAG